MPLKYIVLSTLSLDSIDNPRVGITAGESSNPREAVPKAIRQVFWRILIFYVGE